MSSTKIRLQVKLLQISNSIRYHQNEISTAQFRYSLNMDTSDVTFAIVAYHRDQIKRLESEERSIYTELHPIGE